MTMEPLDSPLYLGALVQVSGFRVRVDDPRFTDSGPIERHILVFPRTSVRIAHTHRPPVVADPNSIMFYNRHQRYQRFPLSREGDRCDWFGVRDDVVTDMVSAFDPTARERPSAPYPFVWGTCSNELYLRQRKLTEILSRRAESDACSIEEAVMGLLYAALSLAFRSPSTAGARARASAGRMLAEAARERITKSYQTSESLSDIGRELRVSPFHLSRVFRDHVGMTIHRYRTALRLRASLERLGPSRGYISDLALELGFASHSHFCEVFRKAFGCSPSRAHKELSRRRIEELTRQLPHRFS